MNAEPTIGHNSSLPEQGKDMRNLVDRIVRLEEEKAETQSAIKDIYAEAKSKGYSTKAMRVVVKREMEDADQRDAREATEREVELMIAALGDLASTPLGEAATGGAR